MTAPPTLTLRSEHLAAEVSPLGAELRRLATAEGGELLWDGDPAFWTGRAPILFPIVGRVAHDRYRLGDRAFEMAKHGFARRSTFEVVEQDGASCRLRLAASAEARAHYPFDFRLDLAFTLAGRSLTVAATVANRGDAPMPASFGFHPALRWPLPTGRPRDAHRIVFDRDEPAPIRRLDADGLVAAQPHPTPVEGRVLALRDALFTDDAVIFDRVASRRVVYGAPDGPRLAVSFDDFALLGVWTKPGAGFICIEPWAGMADPQGFDGDFRDKPGVFEVGPGEGRTLAMQLSWLAEGEA